MISIPFPDYPQSRIILGVQLDKYRYHKGDGDMWPLTWASDDNLYGGAGDNLGSPMNFWRIEGDPPGQLFLVNNLPVDPKKYCRIPPSDPKMGIKPAGLLSVKGVLYFAVEAMNYGEDPGFNRQRNVHGWIITSRDFGSTWNHNVTPVDFFTDRLSSCHFLQFGRDYEGARDEYVYAYFPGADDGNSYWENNDYLLFGRVDRDKILNRNAWEFYCGFNGGKIPQWSKHDEAAVAVFRYPLMTGENHVAYNPGIKCYLMGNYGFYHSATGKPRPYHHQYPESVYPTQLTLFEAPEPWGPWSLFYRDDNWGTYGDYQPNFPAKWMSKDGKVIHMVSSGTYDDYNFTTQRLTLVIGEEREKCGK
jgi:hypothetical protein